MIHLSFSKTDLEELRDQRFHHPHPHSNQHPRFSPGDARIFLPTKSAGNDQGSRDAH